MGKFSNDRSAEYLSIIDGFREHGKGMGDVVELLQRFIKSSGLDVEFGRKARDIQARFSAIQSDISGLMSSLSSSSTTSDSKEERLHGPPVIIRCKQWEDFGAQALNASTVSFLYRDEEKGFQVDALKGGRVYTFSGQLPSNVTLLRTWLSKELRVEEDKVVEGILAIG
jgi:hypothetical protein